MQTTTQKYQAIDRNAIKAKLDRKDGFRLWNVLTKEYYKPDQNIPGSQWVPVDELEKRLPGLNAGKDEKIVVYCASFQCTASKKAAATLADLGFSKVFAYEGGLKDWSEAGFPLETIKG
ncbi:MAG: hypothetical protein KCHDKBKB_02896 [Elusimicrobia bacterium]|jgi:rhodanese-related sulfurtransferase|nr:hypothetical protein [Elusimicrobiota bacterium]